MRCCFVSLFCENGNELAFLSQMNSSYVFHGYEFTGSDERKKELELSGRIKISREPCQIRELEPLFDYILVSNQSRSYISFVSQTSTCRIEVFNLVKEKKIKKL